MAFDAHTPDQPSELQAIYEHIKSYEPMRVRNRNAYTADHTPWAAAITAKSDAELMAQAEEEYAARLAFRASPQGRFKDAHEAIAARIEKMRLLIQEADSGRRRGWAGNAQFCLSIAEAVETLAHEIGSEAHAAVFAADEQVEAIKAAAEREIA